MSTIQTAVITWFIGINLVTFFVFAMDKVRSTKQGLNRVSENTLLILALLGGSAGALLAIAKLRHKSSKVTFQSKLGVVLLMQMIVVYFILVNYEP